MRVKIEINVYHYTGCVDNSETSLEARDRVIGQ